MSIQTVEAPERFNALGGTFFFKDSPMQSPGLEQNVLGSFVNQACADRVTLDQIEFSIDKVPQANWDDYFMSFSTPSVRSMFIVTKSEGLKLGSELLNFMRDRLAESRYQYL